MVSNAKRMKYVSENEMSTSEEDSYEDSEYQPNEQNKTSSRRPTRKPKVFSRNALMARENRLKKKMYISNLENQVATLKSQNKKLNTIVDNQSYSIADLKKEVKYLKSVLSNSKDIGNLIRNIHRSTGMSATTSLDKKLSLTNVSLQKPKAPIARKTAHPWDENIKKYPSYPTPESSHCLSSPDHSFSDELASSLLLNDLDFPLNFTEDSLFKSCFLENEEQTKEPSVLPLEEHNYTVPISENALQEPDDDIGVCLHVSKHRVSLEFCPSCSENALTSWNS